MKALLKRIAVTAMVSLLAAQARALTRPVFHQVNGGATEVAQQKIDQGNDSLTVPAGTMVPLTLLSVIKSKSTHVGDPVRAQVAFPVAVGDRTAIPAGTFVQGELQQAKATVKVKVKKGQPKPQDLIVHFSRLIFSNGYTVALDATNLDASLRVDDRGMVQLAALEVPEDLLAIAPASAAMQHTTYPPLPPLPPLPDTPHGPNPVAMSLGILGGTVLLALVMVLTAGRANRRNEERTDTLLYDAGYTFEMKLSSPLVLDGAQVKAAMAADAS